MILEGVLDSQTSSIRHFGGHSWGILYTDYIIILDVLILSFLGVTMVLLCKRMHLSWEIYNVVFG